MAIITNDHASELVDTHNLRSQGFHVGEIPGACFCGNLDDLTSAVDSLALFGRPDVVLVEPVGSCTDLAASVIRPLRRLYPERFEAAPYVVLLKPAHAAKILRGGPAGFSPQAEYIFRTQLEEADCVAINRVDQLTAAQIEELKERERRAIEAVSWGMPAVNFDLMRQAMQRDAKAGPGSNKVVYWSRPFIWKNQTLTPNPDTIYFMPFYDTKDVGPVVLEIPPAGDDGSLVEVSGEGRHTRVGRYVRPEWRAQLAQELRLALRLRP